MAHAAAPSRRPRILLLNPNSNVAMTDSMLLAARATPVADVGAPSPSRARPPLTARASSSKWSP